MKVYKVKVNGKVYEVELESVSSSDAAIKAPVAEAAPAAPQASGSGVEVKSPMQGTIVKVNIEVGSSVKKGQCVAVLEAMKMENDIVSPTDGVVKQLLVSKGKTVNNQEVLLIIG